MRIERIELIGFKSFFEKTAFNFHSGITAVVGPNGCGKSNIVDAFRWVLGEQSAKSLRGDSMEDVIFTGSASKKPKGMAEVTLVISGVTNGSSSDAGDLSVTRRLYRSGESEYLMNKTPCRLKDIKNVFLDTGLELKAYSILEQGKIDGILNSKPHERRFLIEEVAGVMKYNVRKAEALSKLDSSRMNLQRLQDIITEVKRQINSIERHAKKAERYKRLFDEIKDIEIKIAVRDMALLGEELGNLSRSENSLKTSETELSSNIHSSDALIEEKKLLCVDNEKALEEAQGRLNTKEMELIEEEGKVSLFKNECDHLKGRLERLLIRGSELAGLKKDITSQINDIELQSKDIRLEFSKIEETLKAKNDSLEVFEKEIKDLEQDLETKRKHIFNKSEEISSLRNDVSSLTLIIEGIDKREMKNLEEADSLQKNIAIVESSIRDSRDEYNKLDKGLKDKNRTKNSQLEDIKKKRESLTEKEEGLYKNREDLAAISSRADSLRELDTGSMSMVGDNVKILCQVADIFEALPEHETAIEAALGDKLNVAVVNDHNEIEKALKFIKENKINRSGFIPANISPGPAPLSSKVLSSDGVIGKAIDFVKVKKGFDRMAELLLQDVVLVNNLNSAFDIWLKLLPEISRNSQPRYFVTLDGEVLEPSGIVFGGIEKGVLKIKREIKELAKNIEDKKAIIQSEENGVSSIKDEIEALEITIASLDAEISVMEKSFHEHELRMENLLEEEQEQKRKLEFLYAELEQDRQEKKSTDQSRTEKNRVCSSNEDERRSIESDMHGTQSRIEDKKGLLDSLRSEITEIMMSSTSIKEKTESFLREEERLRSELTGIEKKKEEMSKEHQDIVAGIEQKENEIKISEDLLKSFAVIISKMKEESAGVKEILEAKMADLSLMEKRQKVYSDELADVRKKLAQVEVRKTEQSLRLEHLKGDIKKSYSIDLDSIKNDENRNDMMPTEEEEERLPSLMEKLQGIGPVNLGTLEELEELKGRYDFLSKQQQDILQSIESLQETISKINLTTQKKLTEAFEALNEKFKEVFNMLFGKGKAELILTEGSILEAGIDIVAQPPGKKLQNMMLLSGGEKALTALALLFAGFMIKPTPLCLLDEVDAPLDESNTDRFTALLTGLSKNIQFIAITHNRRTMEVADYIYGITMEEPGISKVVSMHLAEMV